MDEYLKFIAEISKDACRQARREKWIKWIKENSWDIAKYVSVAVISAIILSWIQ